MADTTVRCVPNFERQLLELVAMSGRPASLTKRQRPSGWMIVAWAKL
jgi:hypothetical protein